ncbi:metallophosphoesterase [Winogradskyella sp.]|nr:metallophosphoesterase [Winogradskyella sp.]MDC0009212.1 metallophosphoesterase [Winogradskyella sp.]
MKDFRPRIKNKAMYEKWTNKENRVLVIGDTHCPFDLDTYLDFLVDTYKTYNCNRVVHIGDEIDNHFGSYHETDANGMGGGDELELAIKRLNRYYKQFPNAEVIIGNHTRMVMRKAQTGGIPKKWIKDYNEVLEVPNWEFKVETEIDGVKYVHGEGGTARSRAKMDMQSTVQGHLHTQLYSEYMVGNNSRVFGLQVGCGINHEQYAFAYAKAGKKPAIGCGVVIGGHTAIAVPMQLENYGKKSRFK